MIGMFVSEANGVHQAQALADQLLPQVGGRAN